MARCEGFEIFLSAAYRRGALALVDPIGRGTAPLLGSLGGWFVLGEPIGLLPLVSAVVVGAVLSVR